MPARLWRGIPLRRLRRYEPASPKPLRVRVRHSNSIFGHKKSPDKREIFHGEPIGTISEPEPTQYRHKKAFQLRKASSTTLQLLAGRVGTLHCRSSVREQTDHCGAVLTPFINKGHNFIDRNAIGVLDVIICWEYRSVAESGLLSVRVIAARLDWGRGTTRSEQQNGRC